MAISPNSGPAQGYQNQQIQTIGQSGKQAANALLQGGQQIGSAIQGFQNAIPGAKQGFAGQAALGVAQGAAHSGRQGASAYGGALQGGLQAAQQAANFDVSSQQALSDMYAQQAGITSEGYATQAATAGKMLELGSAEQRQQQSLLQINSEISRIKEDYTHFYGDDTKGMSREFDRLIGIYASDPQMVQYLQGEKQKMVGHYSGIDGPSGSKYLQMANAVKAQAAASQEG